MTFLLRFTTFDNRFSILVVAELLFFVFYYDNLMHRGIQIETGPRTPLATVDTWTHFHPAFVLRCLQRLSW